MHYYQFNIGDYASHTKGLSLHEDLAYRRMMDEYYLHEQALNGCSTDVARCIGMREQQQEVDYILQRFFKNEDGKWTHKRIQREINEYHCGKESKSKAGKASAEARKIKALEQALEQNSTSVEQTLNSVELTKNQEPRTNNHSINTDTNVSVVEAKASPSCPHLEIIAAYNRILPELQHVIPDRWSGARADALKSRWRESSKHQSLQFWERFFSELRRWPFYMGENDRQWKADLGWIVKRANFDKLIEKFTSARKAA